MKLKNGEIIQLLNRLDKLSEVELPVRIAYGIKKNVKKLMDEYKDYDEQRRELIKKYNNDEKSKDYGKELRELLDIETDIEFYKVPESVFESGNFIITPQQLSTLDFMVE
jgi:uncharacterized membrane protein YgaE (UPF0421/DUF939 family)